MTDSHEIRLAALNAAALVAAGANVGRRPQDNVVNANKVVSMAREFEKYLQGYYVE